MINVMQTTKHRLPDDLPVACFADRRIGRARSALANRAVRMPAIEILHIFGQHSTQTALIEDEHVVEAFSAQRSHPALGDRICLRRLNGVRIWVIPRLLTRWSKELPHVSARHDRG
jgi:hypothetical protein